MREPKTLNRCFKPSIDRAIDSGNDRQLALALTSLVEIAKSSPFPEFADLSTLRATLDDPDYIWEC